MRANSDDLLSLNTVQTDSKLIVMKHSYVGLELSNNWLE